MFVVPVPKEFTPQDKYTWTIVANGQSTSIPLRLHNDYVVSPFIEIAVENTPPVIRFEQNGSTIQGPIATLAKAVTHTASLSAPLPLTVWATDDMKYTSGTNAPMTKPRPPVTLTWSKYRGPGTVAFDKASLWSSSYRRLGAVPRPSAGRQRRTSRSASRATTCCTSPRTITPARVVAAFSAAGLPAL